MPSPSLAVVLPAYKPQFLDEAISSLVHQTDHEFDLIVADDGGPPAISAIVFRWQRYRPIRYVRFDTNIGRHDLAAHWNRAVELSNADWIWLFSDDDVAAAGCIKSARTAIASTVPATVLLRFNTRIIDAAGQLQQINPPHPESELFAGTLYHKLRGHRESFAIEYVFRRSAWQGAGGFAAQPLAWCTDDLTWMRIAGSSSVLTLSEGVVDWRKSKLHISARGSTADSLKFQALGPFLREALPALETFTGCREAVRRAVSRWLIVQAVVLCPSYSSIRALVTALPGKYIHPNAGKLFCAARCGAALRVLRPLLLDD